MKKILVIGRNRFLNDDSSEIDLVETEQKIDAIKAQLQDADQILFDLDEVDADLMTEAVIDIIVKQRYSFEKLVYLTRLGIDLEYSDQSFANSKIEYAEYLKQQRYAIKLIDELEQPYTVIRIPELKVTNNPQPRIISEGQKIKQASVSHETIHEVLLKIMLTNQFDNQSIAVLDD